MLNPRESSQAPKNWHAIQSPRSSQWEKLSLTFDLRDFKLNTSNDEEEIKMKLRFHFLLIVFMSPRICVTWKEYHRDWKYAIINLENHFLRSFAIIGMKLHDLRGVIKGWKLYDLRLKVYDHNQSGSWTLAIKFIHHAHTLLPKNLTKVYRFILHIRLYMM